jgi:hypothetical protein
LRFKIHRCICFQKKAHSLRFCVAKLMLIPTSYRLCKFEPCPCYRTRWL